MHKETVRTLLKLAHTTDQLGWENRQRAQHLEDQGRTNEALICAGKMQAYTTTSISILKLLELETRES